MPLGDAFFDFLRAGSFEKGANALGIAQAMDDLGQHGPAARFYDEAVEFFRVANADDPTFWKAARSRNACLEKAKARGEDTGVAFGPPYEEIRQFPELFARWYEQWHRGQQVPWRAPTAEEVRAAQQAQREAEAAEKRREKAETERAKKRDQAYMRAHGRKLFGERWQALLAAAARAEEGDEEALREAVSLWKRPKGKKPWWGEAWADFAKDALAKVAEAPEGEQQQKALRALPRIAMEAEDWSVWVSIGAVVLVCSLYPIGYGVSRGLIALAPEEPGSFMSACFGAVLGLLAIPFGLVAWLMKYLIIPIAAIGVCVVLFHSLPRHRKASAAVAAGDLGKLPAEWLFRATGGSPLAEERDG